MAEQRRLLTIDELADWLAIPKATIYRWRAQGGGPTAFRVGKHLRWDEQEVRRWLTEHADDREPAA